jgi:hypothetical protein
MSGLFNTNKPSPFDLLPTEVLLSRKDVATVETVVSTTKTIPTTSKAVVVPRVLDKRTADKVLDYIYEQEGKVTRNKKKEKKADTSLQFDDNGHMSTFFIPRSGPSSTSRGGNEKNLLDIIGDSMGIKTDNNGQAIDIEVLKRNKITVEVLVSEIGVSITEFYVANILTTFDDLLYIGFKLTDLTLSKREYFSCDVLKTLYKVNCEKLAQWNITFDLETLMVGEFYVSELNALDFSIDPLIMSGCIARSQLRSLKYPLSGLISLKFNKENVDKLRISSRRAVRPQSEGGFGWSLAEYNAIPTKVNVSQVKK